MSSWLGYCPHEVTVNNGAMIRASTLIQLLMNEGKCSKTLLIVKPGKNMNCWPHAGTPHKNELQKLFVGPLLLLAFKLASLIRSMLVLTGVAMGAIILTAPLKVGYDEVSAHALPSNAVSQNADPPRKPSTYRHQLATTLARIILMGSAAEAPRPLRCCRKAA